MSYAMNSPERDSTELLAQARSLVSDLLKPRPAIYWIDFIACMVIGYGAAGVYLFAPMFSLVQGVAFLIAGCALYRLGTFMHEISHFRNGEMRAFTVTWNLLAGIPLLMPSFFYQSHLAHHNTHHYGTDGDGEYLPFTRGGWRQVFFFMCQAFFQPLWVVARFVFLTPISFITPSLRRWTLEHASSFVINFRFRREVPENAPRGWWALLDVACCLRAMGLFVFPVYASLFGSSEMMWNAWLQLGLLYAIAVFTLILNNLRTLAAHRYESEGSRMSHVDQLLDSVDITGDRVFTELLCPLGLRFHALHHLFPAIPYHNLTAAHLRLMEHLPAESPYRRVVRPSFFAAMRDFVRSIRESHADRAGTFAPQQTLARRHA